MIERNISELVKAKDKRLNGFNNAVRALDFMAQAVKDGDFDIPQLDDLKRLYFPSKRLGEKAIHRSARVQSRAYLDSLAITYIQIFGLQREGLALWPYHWLFSEDTGIPKDFYNQYFEDQGQRIKQSYSLSMYYLAEVQRNRVDATYLIHSLKEAEKFDHEDYFKSRIASEYDFRSFSSLFFEQTFETLMSQLEMHLIMRKIGMAELLCLRDCRNTLGQTFEAHAGRKRDKSFDTSDRACQAYGKKLLGRLKHFKPLLANAADAFEGYKEAVNAASRCKPVRQAPLMVFHAN